MFAELEDINARPAPFEVYTAEALWTDEHTSKRMLESHLEGSVDLSSRNSDFIDRPVRWILSRFAVDETTRIVDFGCGPGLYTTPFSEAGARVTWIDFSERSIKHAATVADRRGLEILDPRRRQRLRGARMPARGRAGARPDRNHELRFASELMAYFGRVAERRDPAEADRRLGASRTTMGDLLAVQEGRRVAPSYHGGVR